MNKMVKRLENEWNQKIESIWWSHAIFQIPGYHSYQIRSKRSTGIRISHKAHSTGKAFELDRDVRGPHLTITRS
jgi:hypothetical protein